MLEPLPLLTVDVPFKPLCPRRGYPETEEPLVGLEVVAEPGLRVEAGRPVPLYTPPGRVFADQPALGDVGLVAPGLGRW